MAARNEPHPWLFPVYRRVALMVVCVLWLGFEAWVDPGELWFWMAVAMTAYGLWDLFLSGKYARPAAS